MIETNTIKLNSKLLLRIMLPTHIFKSVNIYNYSILLSFYILCINIHLLGTLNISL